VEHDPLHPGFQPMLFSIQTRQLRVGDMVDFAYSLTGEEPGLRNRVGGVLAQGLQVPAARIARRLKLPPGTRTLWVDHRVEYGVVTSAQKPAEPEELPDGSFSLVTDVLNPPTVEVLAHEPPWYLGAARLRYSNWKSWAEVVEAVEPLYATEAAVSEELEELITGWKTEHPQEEDRAKAAVAFVQAEIRYEDSGRMNFFYQPTPAGATLERRWGDSLAAAILLRECMRRLGFPSVLVLAASGEGPRRQDYLPDPTLFWTVLVEAQIGERTYWFDPSLEKQEGPLGERRNEMVAWGLRIAPGEVDLTDAPWTSRTAPSLEITERFELGKTGEPAQLTVQSIFRGKRASNIRAQLAQGSAEDLSESFVKFYADRYRKVEAVAQLEIQDERAPNEIKIIEKYRLPEPWSRRPDGVYEFTFSAHALAGMFPGPEEGRKVPLETNGLDEVIHIVDLALPTRWPIKPADLDESAGGYAMKHTLTPSARNPRFYYRGLVTQQTISPGNFAQVRAFVQKTDENLTWTLTTQPEKSLWERLLR
jgi:hypothetical protein